MCLLQKKGEGETLIVDIFKAGMQRIAMSTRTCFFFYLAT